MLKDSATDSLHGAPTGFEHEAVVHATDADFVERAAAFVSEGLAAGETIVAALPPERIAVLRDALGADRHKVRFADMTVAGGNPARLIPFWRNLIEQHPGPVRAVSEAAYPGRSAAAYDEVLLHEALSDLAFADDRSFRLYCVYEASVGIDPTVTHAGASGALAEKTFRTALDGVPDRAERWEFGPDELAEVRQWLGGQAASHGVSRDRLEDLSLALHEICTNSIRFGGGRGLLAVWIADGHLICDVTDRGRIDDLLVGRVLPPLDGLGGRGVWLANQLCDLAQLRSGDDFTQVRLHTRLR